MKTKDYIITLGLSVIFFLIAIKYYNNKNIFAIKEKTPLARIQEEITNGIKNNL